MFVFITWVHNPKSAALLCYYLHMNQLTFRCKKDGTEFKLKQGITKGQHYKFQAESPNTYDQQVQETLLAQSQEFADSVFEHVRHCDGEILADNSTFLIAD